MRWRRTCMNLQKPGNRYPEPLTARSYLKTPFKRHVTRFTFFSPFISIYLHLSSWFLSSFCGVQYSPVPFFPPLVAPGEDRAGLGARHAQGGEGRQRGCGGRSAAAAKQPWRWAGGVGPGDWNLGLGLGGWTLETWGSRLENFFFSSPKLMANQTCGSVYCTYKYRLHCTLAWTVIKSFFKRNYSWKTFSGCALTPVPEPRMPPANEEPEAVPMVPPAIEEPEAEPDLEMWQLQAQSCSAAAFGAQTMGQPTSFTNRNHRLVVWILHYWVQECQACSSILFF